MNVLLPKMPEPKLLADREKPASLVVTTRSEMSFITGESQTGGAVPVCTFEAMVIRAETMTAVLEGILRSRPPPHWGIND